MTNRLKNSQELARDAQSIAKNMRSVRPGVLVGKATHLTLYTTLKAPDSANHLMWCSCGKVWVYDFNHTKQEALT